jgi:predicted ATP-binding protein involved in virulence
MHVSRLRVAGFRGVDSAEIELKPGINLIVGVNGVGKSSALHAIAIAMDAVARRVHGARASLRVDEADIRSGHSAAIVDCDITVDGARHRFLSQTYRAPQTDQRIEAPPSGFIGSPPSRSRSSRELAVFFSTRRAVPSSRAPSKAALQGGAAAATSGALTDRELGLVDFAQWMTARQALVLERPGSATALNALDSTVQRFLPGYSRLRPHPNHFNLLTIDHGGDRIEVGQLSDGERGALALVLDLTRRMAQIDPESEDPAATSEAVVLVDEIDLHLHPQWQRNILHNLEAAFPQCQLILTTHSPQVIGEVHPERIIVMQSSGIYTPERAFGVDSSSILEEIMGTPARTRDVASLLSEVSEAIDRGQMDAAKEGVGKLSRLLGDEDPETIRFSTLLDFLEG